MSSTASLHNYKNVPLCFVAFNKSALKTTVHNLEYLHFELECFIAVVFIVVFSLIKISLCLT